jgi:hypothetical protein
MRASPSIDRPRATEGPHGAWRTPPRPNAYSLASPIPLEPGCPGLWPTRSCVHPRPDAIDRVLVPNGRPAVRDRTRGTWRPSSRCGSRRRRIQLE